MASGSANVRFGMIRPIHVLKMPMSDHSRNSGAAIAIAGNVVIDRTSARIGNLPLNRRRASAYAQNEPTVSAATVEITIAATTRYSHHGVLAVAASPPFFFLRAGAACGASAVVAAMG